MSQSSTRWVSLHSESGQTQVQTRRRVRRVLFPASRNKRPVFKQEPDQVQRWLLLLSALVCLQIYTEDPQTDLQNQRPDLSDVKPHDGEPILSTAQSGAEEVVWRVFTVRSTSESQLECVVS